MEEEREIKEDGMKTEQKEKRADCCLHSSMNNNAIVLLIIWHAN